MTDNRGGSPVDDLERALADMLHRRADSVHESAVISLTDAPHAQRWSRGRTAAVVSAVAASVIMLTALGSVVLNHRDRNPSPNAASPSSCAASTTGPGPSCTTTGPVRTSPSRAPKEPVGLTACTISPSALHSALAAGKVGVDQPVNVGVGVGTQGSFLMDQDAYSPSGTQTHAELALFGPKHGQTVWLASDPAQNVADVDPAGAVSKDWVVYAVRTKAQGPDAAIYAWRRTTGQTVTVRTLTAAEHRTLDLNLSAPIVIGDIAYWVEQSVEEGSHNQRIVGRNLTTGRTVLRIDIHNVDRLLDVGGVLSWVSSASDGTKTLLIGGSAAVEVGLPTSAAGPASWITSDGTTVRWQIGTGASARAYSARVDFGHGVPSLRPGAAVTLGRRYENWESNAGPLFTFPGPSVTGGGAGDVVVDTSTARAMTWPPGTHVDLVSGDSVIVHVDGLPSGSSAPGSSSVSRVSLGALRAMPCH